MKRVHLITQVLGIVIIAGVASGVALHKDTNTPAPQAKVRHAITKKEASQQVRQDMPLMSLEPSIPITIAIPSQNITASVKKVGLTAAGDMDAPQDALSVGWYRYGYLPGSIGKAVLAGHLMHKDGRGAFYALPKVTSGSEIVLTTEKSIQYYRVVDTKRYPNDASNLEEVFGSSSQSMLSLVTCTGSWDEAQHRYSERLVVFATFTREEHI